MKTYRALRRKPAVFATLLLLLLLLICICSFRLPAARGGRGGADGAAQMKTVCVGRFLIDLPQEAEFPRTGAFIDGFNVGGFAETDAAFNARVATRQAEIEAQPNKMRRQNLESVTKVDVNGFTGKIFVFGRSSTYTMEFETKHVWEDVKLEGYVHSAGVSFDFISDGYDPKLIGNLPKLIGKLRLLGPEEIPHVPGFCFGPGMFVEPLTADQGERTTLFVSIPGHTDLAIAFSTTAGLNPSPGLLARDAVTVSREPFWVRAAFTALRKGKRTINGLVGDELGYKVTELNFSTVYGLDWEMEGAPTDVYAPLLHLEMETGRAPRAGGKPVQSSLAQTAVLELWDKIASSIRIRPAAPDKAAASDPPVPPLGSFSSAGELCPQTGWWQCSEGGGGVSVLGGERQFLRKGQRMPQALLLPPQTLWEKVKGVQRSFEASTPTSWKLVCKRATPRVTSAVRLDEPKTFARADALSAGTVLPSTATASAPIGTYVKTGEACPASGWWRCMESSAVDGTRWFAQGSLLPAATFEVPPGAFGKTGSGTKAIQRRSEWKFVRHAAEPEVGERQTRVREVDEGERPLS